MKKNIFLSLLMLSCSCKVFAQHKNHTPIKDFIRAATKQHGNKGTVRQKKAAPHTADHNHSIMHNNRNDDMPVAMMLSFRYRQLPPGASYDVLVIGDTMFALGGQFGLYKPDKRLNTLYGSNPMAGQV